MYSTEDEPADRETARSLFIGSGRLPFCFFPPGRRMAALFLFFAGGAVSLSDRVSDPGHGAVECHNGSIGQRKR